MRVPLGMAVGAALVAGYFSVPRGSVPTRPAHAPPTASVVQSVGAKGGDRGALKSESGGPEAMPGIEALDAVLATLNADLGQEGVPLDPRELEAQLQGDPELLRAVLSLPVAAEQLEPQDESWAE